MKKLLLLIIPLVISGHVAKAQGKYIRPAVPFLVILGTAQDAGYPQAGCEANCCKPFYEGRETKKYVSSLALVDDQDSSYYLFDATPDIAPQMRLVRPLVSTVLPRAIFLTHAHIGHYAGLMYLGREAIGAKDIPVYCMPRMDSFLRNNGPWNQLVSLHNIIPKEIQIDNGPVELPHSIFVTPFLVPHRDEYSETAGYVIDAHGKKILYIPDIDKWEKWDCDIVKELADADLAIIDGTFFRNGELKGRDMKEVPHPFVEETMKKLEGLPLSERRKIVFIHFNHTNPLLRESSKERKEVEAKGFRVAKQGQRFYF